MQTFFFCLSLSWKILKIVIKCFLLAAPKKSPRYVASQGRRCCFSLSAEWECQGKRGERRDTVPLSLQILTKWTPSHIFSFIVSAFSHIHTSHIHTYTLTHKVATASYYLTSLEECLFFQLCLKALIALLRYQLPVEEQEGVKNEQPCEIWTELHCMFSGTQKGLNVYLVLQRKQISCWWIQFSTHYFSE